MLEPGLRCALEAITPRYFGKRVPVEEQERGGAVALKKEIEQFAET